MKHIKAITVTKASIDPGGQIFLQIWLAVVGWMITSAVGDKG